MSNQINFHPDRSMLVEFSAGTLETALTICVSAHLHFCDQCRSELLSLDQLGSRLMSDAKPSDIDESLLDTVMAKIDEAELAQVNSKGSARAPVNEKPSSFPFSVNKLIESTEHSATWSRLNSSLDIARLKTGQDKFEVALHRLCAGGKAPKHDHQGIEYTVVLKGSLSDERSVYSEGDFLVRQPGDIHQPMGGQNSECICLSALAAPIKLTSPLGFLMKPWLQIQPM